ncbi:C6 zinc finger domain-containing protein, partial [Coniochaeta hoffmannii]
AYNSVLQWPHFDALPSLRQNYHPIFHLERSRRPAFRTRPMSMCPYASPHEVDAVFDAFERGVNFWYPTVSRAQLAGMRRALVVDPQGEVGLGPGEETERCLALLTMALGCASQVIGGLAGGGREAEMAMGEGEWERRRARREMGDRYFDCVMRMLHVAHTDVSPAATHCLLFVALYFAFLRRPLQAWEYINAAAAKCLLLLSYPPTAEPHEETERIRRIFWSCYILESDYLAELSVPVSGVGRIESSVPLPGAYHTHSSPQEEELSSLYFLACISMRRLLNRVHQLLYARDTGACESLDDVRFPVVVAELDHQLEEWRDVLPTAFAFDVGFDGDTGGSKMNGAGRRTVSEHGGFLRQRYLTCRSVIYRPYLMWMLSGAGDGGRTGIGGRVGGPRVSEEVLRNCKACLDACLLHILNLRGFAHTVLVDTWICSLSMAAAMLVLLAACRMPALRSLIGPEVLLAGDHLTNLLEGWQRVSGDPSSPSVNQSVRVIRESARFIGEVYGRDSRPGY